MKALLILSVALLGCSSTPKPEDAVFEMVEAINAQDSARLFNSFSQTYRENLVRQPAAITSLLDTTRGGKYDAAIYSVQQDGSTARVLYGLRAEGRYNLYFDSVYAEVYLEEDGWKYGSILFKQPYMKVRPL